MMYNMCMYTSIDTHILPQAFMRSALDVSTFAPPSTSLPGIHVASC